MKLQLRVDVGIDERNSGDAVNLPIEEGAWAARRNPLAGRVGHGLSEFDVRLPSKPNEAVEERRHLALPISWRQLHGRIVQQPTLIVEVVGDLVKVNDELGGLDGKYIIGEEATADDGAASNSCSLYIGKSLLVDASP